MEIFAPSIDGIYTVLSCFLTNKCKSALSQTCRKFARACSEKYVYQLKTKNIDESFKFPNLLGLNIW